MAYATLSGVLGALLLLTCAGRVASGTPARGQTIDKSYSVGGSSWGSGSTLVVVSKAYNADGKGGICRAGLSEVEMRV